MVVRQEMRADEIIAKMGAGDTTTFQKADRRIVGGRNMGSEWEGAADGRQGAEEA